jgi:cytochrome c6
MAAPGDWVEIRMLPVRQRTGRRYAILMPIFQKKENTEMKKTLLGIVVVFALCSSAAYVFAEKGSDKGEAKFKALCSVCHPNGENVMNPKKTLHKQDREANNVKTADDIVAKMRNPGPGMTKFDEKTVSNKDAHEIAEYIMKTF